MTKHYALLIHDDVQGYSKFTRADIQDLAEKMGAWSQQLKKAGVHRGAQKLGAPAGGVRRKDGSVVVDGPFTEAKELLGGFFMVEVKTEAEALAIARECPVVQYASRVEVREIPETCVEGFKHLVG